MKMGDIRIGFHVSIAGGISTSVDNALKLGCTAFQIFTRNPRGWTAKQLTKADIKSFHIKLASSGIRPDSVMVHMPYLPNLAAPNGELYRKSIETLASEVLRCVALGIPFLVIHLGSHLGKGSESGIGQLVKACNYALEKYNKNSHVKRSKQGSKTQSGPFRILLENMAGQKNSIGSKFEEIRVLLDKLNSKDFGVCLDTCHALTAGYDLRDQNSVEQTLERFDATIGLKHLQVVHLNDSKGEISSNIDRHEHIGFGKIGKEGFAALLHHKAIRGLPMIMETPVDDEIGDAENMTMAMNLSK